MFACMLDFENFGGANFDMLCGLDRLNRLGRFVSVFLKLSGYWANRRGSKRYLFCISADLMTKAARQCRTCSDTIRAENGRVQLP